MNKEKEILNEEEKMHELEESVTETNMVIKGFDQPAKGNTRKTIQSTVEDPKLLFNLEDHVDFKLNDMEGKIIKVTDIVVKTYEKDIPERLNEITGELETVERNIVTILLDDTGTSYVTASKLFAMRAIQLIQMYGVQRLHEGIEIRITKTVHSNSGNKKLGFEIV